MSTLCLSVALVLVHKANSQVSTLAQTRQSMQIDFYLKGQDASVRTAETWDRKQSLSALNDVTYVLDGLRALRSTIKPVLAKDLEDTIKELEATQQSLLDNIRAIEARRNSFSVYGTEGVLRAWYRMRACWPL